jgi:rhodanese-related sulfurtransferase
MSEIPLEVPAWQLEWVLIVDTAGARAAEMAMWLRTRSYQASSLEGGIFAWRGTLEVGPKI